MLESVILEILFAAEKNEEKKEYIFFQYRKETKLFKKTKYSTISHIKQNFTLISLRVVGNIKEWF